MAKKSAARQQNGWAGLEAQSKPSRNKIPPTSPRTTKQKSPYGRYLDAKVGRLETGEFSPHIAEKMQRAFLDALRSRDPLPDEMRVELAFAFEYVCAGYSPELLTPIKRPGGREPPIAKHLQSNAIQYLRWCDDGRISDVSPTKTVSNAYNVGARTVRSWVRAWAGIPTPELHEDYGAKEVTAFMKVSGKQYKRFLPRAIYKRVMRKSETRKVSTKGGIRSP